MKKVFLNHPLTIDGFRVIDDYEQIKTAIDNGETIMHYEFGDSMFPILMNGEYCKIIPTNKNDINVGDAVFCKMDYRKIGYGEVFMVHRCTDIVDSEGERFFKIESTSGTLYGWTTEVYAKCESTSYFERN